MYKCLKVSVIVPARNEEDSILDVIRSVPSFVDHIIVVDDASDDETYCHVSKETDSRLKVIRHVRNMGVGGAVLTGHKISMAVGSEVNAVMAGDGQMDPNYLPRLLDAIVEGSDYAKGNRFSSREYLKGMPAHRVIGNLVLSSMTRFASGYWNIFDSQNGYTAVRTSVLRDLNLDNIEKGYLFENDMLIELGIRDRIVRDVPIPARYRSGHSQIDISKLVLKALPFLLKGFLRRWVFSRRRKGTHQVW